MVVYSDSNISSALTTLSNFDYYIGSSTLYDLSFGGINFRATNQINSWKKISSSGVETDVTEFVDITTDGSFPYTPLIDHPHYLVDVPNTNNRQYMYLIFGSPGPSVSGRDWYVQVPELQLFR